MGEYADMAIDQALNDYWDWRYDDDEDSDADWAPYGRRRVRARRKPTNAEIFADFVDKPIDPSQF